ncbi:hypothetical protein OROMI_012823 [Orobanche minor]
MIQRFGPNGVSIQGSIFKTLKLELEKSGRMIRLLMAAVGRPWSWFPCVRADRMAVCGIKAEMVDGTEQDSYRCFGEPNRENLTKEEDKLIFTFSEEGELQEHGGTARSLE